MTGRPHRPCLTSQPGPRVFRAVMLRSACTSPLVYCCGLWLTGPTGERTPITSPVTRQEESS